ncbi:TniB family NTP-binding protein [Ferdinandcohnia quinoae]|uniref:TniB family NTP-binding protein n=1 Tax=Fredinandcohnia quinoae TaxID=2918902 RepID=A0AAW5ED93_9BACI|nr:TniB family NTP-binding protein [Fredinandcohnia sp. SECRCQ15]MCH1627416.1 TniB family NTP-binding protein [Fredinandcohnia sp. SECRCQ15]
MTDSVVYDKLNGFPASMEEVRSRREKVKTLVVPHPRYSFIMSKIEEMHFYSKGSVQPESIFLSGETGVGKTTLLEEYRNRYPRSIIDGYTIVPVLYNKVPVGATPKSVAASLLRSLGDPAYDKGTENSQTARLLYFIKVCKVEMIIIDEFQHLIDRETKHVLNKASDWVKSFCDEAGVPVILCGMPESQKIFAHNAQLDRRFAEKIDMNRFCYTTREEQIEFRGFLKSIDEELPFYHKSFLADKKLSDRMFYATNGVPYYVNKILLEATTIAAKSGNDSLDENHLHEAFNMLKISNRPLVTNPFANEDFDILDAYELENRKRLDIKIS